MVDNARVSFVTKFGRCDWPDRRIITLFQANNAEAGLANKHTRELLAPVYGSFTEGFHTRDLKKAKALLDDPGSPPLLAHC
jgi:hypothetical protein